MESSPDYAQKIDKLRDECPIKATVDVIRGRWKPYIMWELNQGTKRFSDLQSALPGCHANVLTTQLRQLEADGVVTRTVHPGVPARVDYSLTAHGRQLFFVMDQLHTWGTVHLERQAAATPRSAKR